MTFASESNPGGGASRLRMLPGAGIRRSAHFRIYWHGVFCDCLRIGQEAVSGFRVISLNGPEHPIMAPFLQVIRFEQDAGIALFGYLRR